jgi:hypothetical protein
MRPGGGVMRSKASSASVLPEIATVFMRANGRTKLTTPIAIFAHSGQARNREVPTVKPGLYATTLRFLVLTSPDAASPRAIRRSPSLDAVYARKPAEKPVAFRCLGGWASFSMSNSLGPLEFFSGSCVSLVVITTVASRASFGSNRRSSR